MPVVTRTYPAGTFAADDIAFLRRELRSDMTIVGECRSIRLTPGAPNDTLDFEFDVAPNTVALDAAIAAYPIYQGKPVTNLITAPATWVALWEEPLRELDTCYYRFEADVRDVSGAIDNALVRVDGSCRRLVAGNATNFVQDIVAPANGFGLICQVVGNVDAYSVQIQTTAAETIEITPRLQIRFEN